MRIVAEEFGRFESGEEGRHHRQSLIPWWQQSRIAEAHFLVVGAGALGNEVLKNLVLLGAHKVLIYDMDRVERSNLNRSVLFRADDEGALKAEVAARALSLLDPECVAVPRSENVVHRAGLGVFAWADVVIGCLDNREARVFVNSACAATGRPWIDGAIESLSGIVRVFDPANGPCYECTMNEVDRRLLAERRSCAMLARAAAPLGRVPATVTSAALIGALQAQEAIKLLHDQPALVGEGLHTNGLWNETSRVSYPRREDCMGHDRLPPLEPLGAGRRDVRIGDLVARAERELGAGATLEFSRDIVTAFLCPECDRREACGEVLGAVGEKDAACPVCGTHRIVETAASTVREGPIDPATTPADLGLPAYDVLVARVGVDRVRAWLLDADAAEVLGPLAPDAAGKGEG